MAMHLTMSKKLSLLLCLVFSVFYFTGVAYYIREKEALLVQNKYYELLQAAAELERSMNNDDLALNIQKISETDIDKTDINKQEKIRYLNQTYQAYIDQITVRYPQFGFGIYCRELDNTIAIGPIFNFANMRSAHVPQIYETYRLGQPQFFEIPNSRGWEGDPVLNTTYPVISNGQIIGHTWANVKKTDVQNQIQGDIFKFLAGFVFLWSIHIVIIRAMFVRMDNALGKLTSKIREQQDDAEGIKAFPELIPILDEIRELKNRIKTENEEKERLYMQMAQISKTNLISEMAASVAHEIRNPMQVVKGYIQFMMTKSDQAYKAQYTLILEELERMNEIITNYLSLARNKTNQKELKNLASVITNIQPLIYAEAVNQGVELELQLEQNLIVSIDEKEIKQVILNLCRNAFDALGDKANKKVIIKTEKTQDEVVLSVIDNGVGIDPEYIEKVFDPFYSTKEEGTGLGLAVCHSIADRHGAKFEVASEPGVGSTFSLKFQCGPV